jgi:predicted metal-binding membrane protein
LRATVPNSDVFVLRGAGLALLAAGSYQWSPAKWACLKHCQSPLDFLMQHWRDGMAGGGRMGLIHGLYCFGCCWGLMTILFVMGVMHLGWMAAIGAIILLEKLIPHRHWIPKAVGAVFVVVGIFVLINPSLLYFLSSEVVIR